MADEAVPTIYEWAGGRPAFARWLECFYDAVEGDDLLAPVFGGRVGREHRDNVVAWWCEVMGGPALQGDGCERRPKSIMQIPS